MRASEESQQTTCPNCGAGFAIDEARCPYCGQLNPSGAEKAYMDALDDINDETGDLAEDARESIDTSIRRNAKRTIVVIVIVAMALASLFAIATCMDRGQERRELRDYQAREAFRTQYFEEFDRLYEAGDDDALSAYVWNLSDDPGFEALFTWEHVGLLQAHDDWEALRSVADHVEGGTCTIDDYTWSVSTALRLARLDGNDTSPSAMLTPEEEKRAAGYREYARQVLRETLQMNDGEIAAFADEAKDEYGYIQRDMLKKNLETRLTQLGTPH